MKRKTLYSRVVMPPMVVNRPLTKREAWEGHGRRAQGGAALVIVEAADILCFGADHTAEGMRRLVEAMQRGGAANSERSTGEQAVGELSGYT